MALVLSITKLTDVYLLLGQLYEIYVHDGVETLPSIEVWADGGCRIYLDGEVEADVDTLPQARERLMDLIERSLKARRLKVVNEYRVGITLVRDDGAESNEVAPGPGNLTYIKRKVGGKHGK